jgi:GGDEF domain-containing protein
MLRPRRNGDAVAYCMIDLDNFKQINDMQRPPDGDAVLVMLAERLRATLPAEASGAARGRRIRLVMPTPSGHAERVDDLVIRLFEQWRQPIDAGTGHGRADHVDRPCSGHDADGTIGMVIDAATLMHRADMALYHAKKKGRNRYFWFEPQHGKRAALPQPARNRHPPRHLAGRIRALLRTADRPRDRRAGRLRDARALALAQLGLISPDIFIPIAEEIGLITEMSEA